MVRSEWGSALTRYAAPCVVFWRFSGSSFGVSPCPPRCWSGFGFQAGRSPRFHPDFSPPCPDLSSDRPCLGGWFEGPGHLAGPLPDAAGIGCQVAPALRPRSAPGVGGLSVVCAFGVGAFPRGRAIWPGLSRVRSESGVKRLRPFAPVSARRVWRRGGALHSTHAFEVPLGSLRSCHLGRSLGLPVVLSLPA